MKNLKYYDKFNLYDIQHKDSKINNNDLHAWSYLHVYEGHMTFNRFINLKKLFDPNVFYARKPKMLEFKNAYIDESFRIFTSDKKMVSESAPGFGRHFSGFDIPHTWWSKTKQYFLNKIYDDVSAEVLSKKHLSIKSFKEEAKQTFADKNTIVQHCDFPVINFLISGMIQNYNIFMHWHFFPFLYQWNHLSSIQKQQLKIVISEYYPDKIHNYGVNSTLIKNMLFDIGVKEDQLFIIQPGHLYQFPVVYRPAYSIFHKHVMQDNIQYLKNLYLDPDIIKKYKGYERIMIVRESSRGRRLDNMNELNPILTKYHFKKVHMLDFSFKEIINLLQNTKYIIAVLGYESTNLIFAQDAKRYILIAHPMKHEQTEYTTTIGQLSNQAVFYQEIFYKKVSPKNFEKGIQAILSS